MATTINVSAIYKFFVPPDRNLIPRDQFPSGQLGYWLFKRSSGVEVLPVTEEELRVWTEAGQLYRAALDDAHHELEEKLKRTSPLLLALGVRRRARDRYRERITAADQAYRPVFDQIKQREDSRRRRFSDEVNQRAGWQNENWPELKERYLEVGRREIWTFKSWANMAEVYRLDLREAAVTADKSNRGQRALSAQQLAEQLVRNNVVWVRWDPDSCRATLDQCSVSHLYPLYDGSRKLNEEFQRWWVVNVGNDWPSHDRTPLHKHYGRGRSGHGVGSSDYGGGQYGSFGGSH